MSDQKTISIKFVDNIKRWVNLDNQMKKMREELKIIADEKKELEGNILNELEILDEKVIEITDGKLRKNVSKTQVPLKKEHIHKTINALTKDSLQTTNIINYMMKSREYVERVNLKRTKNRGLTCMTTE